MTPEPRRLANAPRPLAHEHVAAEARGPHPFGMRSALFFVALALAGCRSAPNTDAARVRAQLGIPHDAPLVSIDASPPDDRWQREGLRIVAVYRVAKPALAFASWSPLPLPANVASFRRAPVELPSPAGGVFRCEVGVYTGGTSHAMTPCASAPARFDMFQAAVFDPATEQVTAVVTYYY